MLTTTTVQAIYLIAVLTGVGLGYIVWQHREKSGALPLFGSIIATTTWSLLSLLMAVTSSYELSVWLLRAVFVPISLANVMVLLFVLEYTGREHLVRPRIVGALLAPAALVSVLSFTNPRGLMFRSLEPDPTRASGLGIEFGLAASLSTLYLYALSAVVFVLLVEMLFRSRGVYRGQVAVLILALLTPLFGNLVYVLYDLSFDTTPVSFVAASALFTLAITRYRLIDLTPIARDRVVDDISDAMFVIDPEGRLVDINPAGREVVETFLGDVDLIGRPAMELMLPEVRELYDRVTTDPVEKSTEFTLQNRHYDITATPIDDGRGRQVGWLFLARDVTEQRRREAELRRRNEQLDQFASVVSHDLRNPLSVADGYVELTRETGDFSHLEEVDSAHDRMDAIIEDVLTLAREGDAVTNPTAVDLAVVAEDAWENVETGDATLRIEDPGSVLADKGRLIRLLENLFRNSVEHGSTSSRPQADDAVEHGSTSNRTQSDDSVEHGTPDGGAPLTIRVGRTGDGFYVEDDGRGIPEADREQVFESGYSGSEGGTGFGLSIVKNVAEAHGWTCRATEGADGGARFEFTDVDRLGE